VAAAASSLQVVVVVVASVTLKTVETELPVVEPLAGELMATTGAIESTVKLTVAEPEPAMLVAVTTTLWAPWLSVVNDAGELQAVAAPPSSEQVVLVGELVAVKTTDAVVELMNAPLAGEEIVTTGAAVTVKVVVADPVFVAWSVAVTIIVWLPTLRPL